MTLEAPAIDHSADMRSKPFFELTERMLNCVRDHDFNSLSGICDDDFGIVDINTEGGSKVIRDRQDREAWFSGLFAQLTMGARTWSEITGYEAVQAQGMGYSVVDFDQVLIAGEKRLRFSVLATIIWKQVGGDWKEARYHSSMLKVVEE
jgi:hypothetical protein